MIRVKASCAVGFGPVRRRVWSSCGARRVPMCVPVWELQDCRVTLCADRADAPGTAILIVLKFALGSMVSLIRIVLRFTAVRAVDPRGVRRAPASRSTSRFLAPQTARDRHRVPSTTLTPSAHCTQRMINHARCTCAVRGHPLGKVHFACIDPGQPTQGRLQVISHISLQDALHLMTPSELWLLHSSRPSVPWPPRSAH